jgi:hypothetical protein
VLNLSDSQRFYGQCVSEWITIKPQMKLITDADILIFVTYPMYYARKIDDFAMEYLNKIRDASSKMTIGLIGHRASDFFNHEFMSLFHIEKIIPRNQIVLLTLAEHTHKNAVKELLKHQDKLGDITSVRLEYFYPILPPHHIMIPKSPTVTFSIQGNFQHNIHYSFMFPSIHIIIYVLMFAFIIIFIIIFITISIILFIIIFIIIMFIFILICRSYEA